nr:MAG TPA: hypothetical protein [Caudoviricetes sp.]
MPLHKNYFDHQLLKPCFFSFFKILINTIYILFLLFVVYTREPHSACSTLRLITNIP